MRSNVRSRKGSTNQSPLDEEALKLFLQRATEHHSAGRFDEAARLYEHVQARNPDALAAPYFLALMDVEFGRLESALDRLRHVTRHDPNSFEAQYSLAYV
ncbi:MAG: tetratricopeptide repeat protein, partial [Parvibaculum sp.]